MNPRPAQRLMLLPTSPSAFRPSRLQRGVALVITLVMLSAITFLAVAYLILTQRERGSVTVAAAQTDAQSLQIGRAHV